MKDEELFEALADAQHEIWRHWMSYVFGSCGEGNEDGTFTIDARNVARWRRLIETDYADLTEPEKASDREQVHRFWSLIERGGGS